MNVRIRPRILFACVCGFCLVGASWYLASTKEQGSASPAEASVVGDTPDRTYIEVGDTNGDGIPDWQEALYPDAPLLPAETFDAEDYIAPTTTTGRFAVSLTEEIMRSNMYGDFGATKDEIIRNGTKRILDEIRFDLYTEDDLLVHDDTDAIALRAYGNAVAEIALGNGGYRGTDSEITIVGRALQDNNPAGLAALRPIVESYEHMRDDMLKTPVPRPLVAEHLALTNVYHALATDINAFEHLFVDPLPALVYLQYYEAHGNALYSAISSLYLALDARGIVWTADDATSRFIAIE